MKKITTLFTALLLALACAIALVGCGRFDTSDHSHTYSSEWEYDSEYHWHSATCEHLSVSNKAKHQLENSACTICGYQKAAMVCDAKMRYSAVPVSNPYDNMISFKDNNYYYYMFELGTVQYVPLQDDAEVLYYNGIDYSLSFTATTSTSNTIENQVTNAVTHCTEISTTWKAEVKAGWDAWGKFPSVEFGYSYSSSDKESNSTTATQSYKNAATYSETKSENFNITFDEKYDYGWYRWVLMGELNVYGLVVYNCADGSYTLSKYSTVAAQYRCLDYCKSSAQFNDNEYDVISFELDGDYIESLDVPTVDVSTLVVGNGTENNPYTIVAQADLSKIAENPSAYYKLFADIDVDASAFAPIEEFSGVFDGNSYSITFKNKRTVNFERIGDAQFGGLFNTNNGTVKNLTINGLDFQSKKNCHTGKYKIAMGAVAGENNGSITDVTVKSGNFVCDRNNSAFGGICGINNGTVSKCVVSDAVIYSTGDCGGIVGSQNAGVVTDCKFSGVIEIYIANDDGGETLRAWGGIVGHSNNSTIKNCYVESIIFNYKGENSMYHKYIVGFHADCNLQIRVGIVCGTFRTGSDGVFADCDYSSANCKKSLSLKGGDFHYGSHEKEYLFASHNGMIGRAAS